MLTDWLMQSKVPSIRYFTLRQLLDKSENDPQVQSEWEAMQTTGPIPQMLAQQTDAGHWVNDSNFYQPKYTSTHWTMLLLTELGADPNDERMQRGVDYMLRDTEQRLQDNDHGWECLWGNILRYALYCGFDDDPRVHTIIDYLATHHDWECKWNNELPCAWGAARTLWGLALIPENKRSNAVKAAIDDGVNFLLERFSLVKANYPTSGEPHKMWANLNVHLMYQVDILFVMRALADLNRLDHPAAKVGLEWLKSKQLANGRWRGSSPYRSRTWKGLGDTPQWVSLQVASILKQAELWP